MKKDTKIRILVADAQPVLIEGLRSIFAEQPDIEFSGEAKTEDEVLPMAEKLKPDIILLDTAAAQWNGLEILTLLRKRFPACRVLVFTLQNSREHITQTVRTGARGYLLKDVPVTDLLTAIRLIHAGEVSFSPTASRVLLDEIAQSRKQKMPDEGSNALSEREREVLALIADGFNNKEIASRLGLGVRTVETHRERIMRKLNIHTVAGLTKYAIRKGLVKVE
ncbi:MAG: response regulator transcription factor [Verrucomicrobiales bacterium]|nr:response regulator transcription factor [Verrucomicrobiales bacterium]